MNESEQTDEAWRTIERAFKSAGGMVYLGEDVTMIQHQLQAGRLPMDAMTRSLLPHCCTTSGM